MKLKTDHEAIALELAAKHKVSKVHVYIGELENGEEVAAYLKEPNFTQKLFIMDKIASTGAAISAGYELSQAIVLKEESDPRTWDAALGCDDLRLGLAGACIPLITVIQNSFKKK